MKIEFDHPTRGKHYRQANVECPSARHREIEFMVNLLHPQPGETIVDFGCGNGVLTVPISRSVGTSGKVYAIDNSRQSMLNLTSRMGHGNIAGVVIVEAELPLQSRSVDAVVTLANFHHVPDKFAMFKEFERVLKPGGRLVIGDVAEGTPVQRYFDGPVDRFCSTGHNHQFLNPNLAWRLCEDSGLGFRSWDLQEVPWEFRDEAEARRFLHLIHDATCTPEECISEAKQYLGFELTGRFLLNWQLFFMIARKPIQAELAKHAVGAGQTSLVAD
ncbi:MAG: methyltransferase domain-containing protein [Planctomycetota bacterium]|nr:methyltransferase domain-containing protein [Planctomycetota bacterium]